MGLTEIGLLLVGLVLGPFINFAVYSFAYFPRPISPWQARPSEIPDPSGSAKLPIIGWMFRRRESVHFGRVFWLRPFLIELATPIALVVLYRYSMDGAFMPRGLAISPVSTLQHQFIAYALLVALMAVATFIDFDERTIPDLVTIPGTILGLVGALVFPDWRMQELTLPAFPALVGEAVPIQANSPGPWDMSWNGSIGLLFGLFFWSSWCFGMADRRWITRRGLQKAAYYFVEVLRRSPGTKMLLVLWVVGVVCLIGAYSLVDPTRWEALLSSLFGIGLGGALVWGFRIVACWAMGQEALGFGDVTLMAMIGSFFGWQIVWLAFFLAPFFGMIFVVIVWILTRDNSFPFGPYLCASTTYCMLDWIRLWNWTSDYFLPPHILVVILVGMLISLGAMLWMIQKLKRIVGIETPR